MKIDAILDHGAPVAGGPLPVRLLLKITGSAIETDESIPLNLAMVLDRSGSMAGEPLEQVIDAAKLVARRIGKTNRLSVVTYDNAVETLARGATGEELADVVARLGAVRTRGATNLSGGWLEGRDCVESFLDPGGVNRVLLMTDGLANEGITDPDSLCGLCRSAASKGVTTTTLGFGPHFDEELLRGVRVRAVHPFLDTSSDATA